MTTILRLLSDIQMDVRDIRNWLEDDVAKKRKMRRLTAEEEARFDETRRMVDERIAYHTAKAEEQERARAEAGKR